MTTEFVLPRWNFRLDAKRKYGFADLIPMVNSHYLVQEAAEKVIGPYNAKQRNSSYPYMAPDRELLTQLIRRGSMNDISYQAFIASLIRFCDETKGMRGLPAPHPSSIHNIQLPLGSFEISQGDGDVSKITIIGIKDPIEVTGLRDAKDIKFIIVRPKLSKLGTASAQNWEVLFFKQAFGYIPTWVDSQLNPRWSGKLN